MGCEPAATEYVRNLLLKYREEGSAIVLIPENLDEVLMLSDTVAVMYNGQFIGVMPAEEADVQRVGLFDGRDAHVLGFSIRLEKRPVATAKPSAAIPRCRLRRSLGPS